MITPVSYFTITGKTAIVATNLTDAAERIKLIRTHLVSFVQPHDADHLYPCMKSFTQHQDDRKGCELDVKRCDGSIFHARLDFIQAKFRGEFSIRVALTDLTGLLF